jgi:YidC/Oxa1 family membrane protein insertase
MRSLLLLLALGLLAPLVAADGDAGVAKPPVPAADQAPSADQAPPAAKPSDSHWSHPEIANASAKVELSTYRASIKRMLLLTQHPVALPKWRSPDREQVDTKQPLAVLDAFNPPPNPDMHGFVSGIGLPDDPGQEGPWSLKQVSPQQVDFTLEREGLAYAMSYRMDESKPLVRVRLTVTNNRAEAVALSPTLRALDGIHQDDPIAEAGYEKVAIHTGGDAGKLETFTFPADREFKRAPDGLSAIDYVALKSRFFAAWWSPGALTIGGAPAANSVDISWTGFTPTTPAGTYHQVMLNVTYGAPPSAPGGVMQAFALKPGTALAIDWSIGVSCMTKEELAKLGAAERQLEYTDAYYSFFKSLANIMTWALRAIASVVKVYGLSVIILTFLIKLLLHRFTYKQYESTMKMQKLAPELKYLQEQYKNDRQKLAMKQMELWKKNGVNPLGGCLPVLIQMPIFIALYQSFCHSADMRGQSFLWIRDLTLPDQFMPLFTAPMVGLITINPLPILYIGVTVWMSMLQKPPTGGDPQQEQMFKMMRWLPVIFGLIFYNMPSGLVLYFTVQAVLSSLEIKLVKRRLGMA